jgi:hypothetical protein
MQIPGIGEMDPDDVRSLAESIRSAAKNAGDHGDELVRSRGLTVQAVGSMLPPFVFILEGDRMDHDLAENGNSTGMFDFPSAPPEEVSDIAAQFIPSGTTEIIGMEMAKLAIAVTMKRRAGQPPRPTILEGHTGLAKTTVLARAHEDAKWPYRTVAGHSNVDVEALIGKMAFVDGETKFQIGILPFCMKYGIAIGFQEINSIPPDVLIMIHEYMDEGRITLHDLGPDDEDFVIEAHPNFRLYGSYNPPEFYPGTRDLSPALKRRCQIVTVKQLGLEDEIRAVIASVPDADEDTIDKVVRAGVEIRRGQAEAQGLFFLSTADLVMWAELLEMLPPYEAGILALMGKVPVEERENVKNLLRIRFAPTRGLEFVDRSVVTDWIS